MNLAVPMKPRPTLVARRLLRVMVVDDSLVVRGLVAQWVEAEPDLELVASLRTGRDAVDQIENADPDVIVLDVDMPVLDGLSALPLLLQKKPHVAVIMASTLTRRNAEISLKALSLGAADYIPKPGTGGDVPASQSYRRELIEKIRALGSRSLKWKTTGRAAGLPARADVIATPETPAAPPRMDVIATPEPPAAPPRTDPLAPPSIEAPLSSEPPISLRAFSPTVPRVLLIGSSTGGPQALIAILGQLGTMLDTSPVLITQHMPPTFTTILAEHLARASGRPAQEAEHDEPVLAGRIYVAPGAKHMRVVRQNGTAVIKLDEGPLINFCRPAVDPLFSSAAEVWGAWNLALILTGMGSDGMRGAADIVRLGGSIIAQDEATSIVWGMPGAVAGAGLCSAVLPLDRIAPKIKNLFGGERA
jgi:two-component system chemotaxis response regulator CheB